MKNFRGILQHDWLKNGFFTGQGYTMTKTSLVKNFKNGRINDMATNMATHFARGVLHRSSFLGNLKASDKILDL